jgi:hypothetical protein
MVEFETSVSSRNMAEVDGGVLVKSAVVYESLWGHTEQVARSIAAADLSLVCCARPGSAGKSPPLERTVPNGHGYRATCADIEERTHSMDQNTTKYDEFEVAGEHLLAKVREVMHEGNVRRIILKREDGSTLIEIPVTTGLAVSVLTAAFAPALVAVGAIAAVVSHVTLVVEREDEDPPRLS